MFVILAFCYTEFSMIGFFEIVKDRMQLSQQSREAFRAVMRYKSLPKGFTLVKPGSVCNALYFVERGLTRTFYVKDGKDVTDWFSMENTIACSIISFVSRKPDRRGIELLEDSALWAL